MFVNNLEDYRASIFKLFRGSKTLINKRLIKFYDIVLSIVKLFQRTIGIQKCPVTNKRIYIFQNRYRIKSYAAKFYQCNITIKLFGGKYESPSGKMLHRFY